MLLAWLIVGYDGELTNEQEQDFNTARSIAHTAEEWFFKEIKQHFTLNDFYRALMVRKAPISFLYKASSVLKNSKLRLPQVKRYQNFSHSLLRLFISTSTPFTTTYHGPSLNLPTTR